MWSSRFRSKGSAVAVQARPRRSWTTWPIGRPRNSSRLISCKLPEPSFATGQGYATSGPSNISSARSAPKPRGPFGRRGTPGYLIRRGSAPQQRLCGPSHTRTCTCTAQGSPSYQLTELPIHDFVLRCILLSSVEWDSPPPVAPDDGTTIEGYSLSRTG